jgi:hypothetical protein
MAQSLEEIVAIYKSVNSGAEKDDDGTNDSQFRTPPQNIPSELRRCPPAPRRLKFRDGEQSKQIDSFSRADIDETTEGESAPKRQKMGDNFDVGESNSRSAYSCLNYVESTGVVTVVHPFSATKESKDRITLRISYRYKKMSPADVQIALIMYKSDLDLRRNLLQEFETPTEEDMNYTNLLNSQLNATETPGESGKPELKRGLFRL